MSRTSAAVLGVIFLLTVDHATVASPPAQTPMNEDEKRLVELVRKLDGKKDVEGLVLVMQAAAELRGGRSSEVKRNVIAALAHFKGEKTVVDALIREAESEDFDASSKVEAIRTMGECGDNRAADALLTIARKGPRADDLACQAVRLAAIQALARLGGPRATKTLLESLCDVKEHENVRASALYLLGRMELSDANREAILLLAANTGENPRVSSAILRLAHETKNPGWIIPTLKALATLSESMEDKQQETRDKAAERFTAGLRSFESLVGKTARLFDQKLEVRLGAATLLKGVEKKVSYSHDDLLKDREERQRVLAFWTDWWNTNKGKLLERAGGERAAKEVTDSTGRLAAGAGR